MATDARTLIGNLIAGSGWSDADPDHDGLERIAGEVADEILRVHAHELAEKIRATAHFYECTEASWDGCEGCTRVEAADWIDPVVTCTCTRWQAATEITDRHHDDCKVNLSGFGSSEVPSV